MMATRRVISKAKSGTQLLSPVWTHLTDVQPTKAEGIYLWDKDGTRYTDFTCGIGVTNTGHCHPKVVQAIQDQAQNLIFGQMNIVVPPVAVELAEQLHKVTPESLDQFFFASSGAEAVEAAVKLARHATKKQNVIVFQGSFHGRSHQTMAMTTAKYIYRVNYQPLPSGIVVAPFPFAHYYGWDEDTTVDFCLKELETLFNGQTKPEETAAIIIEPVLGEGGYVPVPPRFLKELRRLCTEHNIMLIADEVQSGFGRTGQMFAYDHYLTHEEHHTEDDPDIMVMAKGLGSGMPISGIASRSDLMEHWVPGSHGGTYGGGTAVAAAAAVATIDVLQSEGLIENSAQRGQQLMDGLCKLQAKHGDHVIREVRGLGCMVGTELPNKAMAKGLQQACLERNLLIMTCGTYENIIRWIPPLVVTQSQMDEALDIFSDALDQVLENGTGMENVA